MTSAELESWAFERSLEQGASPIPPHLQAEPWILGSESCLSPPGKAKVGNVCYLTHALNLNPLPWIIRKRRLNAEGY